MRIFHCVGGVLVVSGMLAGCAGPEDDTVEPAPPPEATQASSLTAFPQLSDLPSGYRPVGNLANRGTFYAKGAPPAFRLDDGDQHHGYEAPMVWAKEPMEPRTQGLLYGIEDGGVVSAGYLIRQADLITGKSFHGLTLRELDLPPAHQMTVDFVPGETPETNQYLLLWHFGPDDGSDRPMMSSGELPPITHLPDGFVVFACDDYAEAFCPSMGRHYTDPNSVHRPPDANGDEGVIYGEAADKLIFIEYVFTQEELAAGVSWPAMPLDGIPIPPLDNVHVLHFGSPGSIEGRYTVHMYFLPEETYLAWDAEPETL